MSLGDVMYVVVVGRKEGDVTLNVGIREERR